MKAWEKKFINYCVAQGLFSAQQARDLTKQLEQSTHNLLDLVSQQVGWDTRMVQEHLVKAYAWQCRDNPRALNAAISTAKSASQNSADFETAEPLSDSTPTTVRQSDSEQGPVSSQNGNTVSPLSENETANEQELPPWEESATQNYDQMVASVADEKERTTGSKPLLAFAPLAGEKLSSQAAEESSTTSAEEPCSGHQPVNQPASGEASTDLLNESDELGAPETLGGIISSSSQNTTIQPYFDDPQLRSVQSIRQTLPQVLDLIEGYSKEGQKCKGLTTGFDDLDFRLSGFYPANFIVLAGPPGMGKSSLLLNWLDHIAVENHHSVLLFSLQAPAHEVVLKLLCARARVSFESLRRYIFNEYTCGLSLAAEQVYEAQVLLDDSVRLTMEDIRRKTYLIKAQTELDIIMIDYLQLIGAAQNQELAYISRNLKLLARELDLPVVAVSQVKKMAAGSGQRPTLADLPAPLDEDADVVIFLHRPEYYDPDTEERATAELIIAKNRHGRLAAKGNKIAWYEQYLLFDNLEEEQEEEPN